MESAWLPRFAVRQAIYYLPKAAAHAIDGTGGDLTQ